MSAGSMGEHEQPGNVLTEGAVEAITDGRSGLVRGLFNKLTGGGDGQNARKTVTFGDASAVRSIPLYSIIALLTLLLVWWAVTKPWGFSEEVKEQIRVEFQADYDEAIAAGIDPPPRTPTQADFITGCQQLPDDVCSTSDYTQILNSRKMASPGDAWTSFGRLWQNGFQNISLWEHTWASLWRVIRGMFWGTIIGVPIGFAMGLNSKLRGFFDTPVELFRPIPPLAVLPLFLLWFGIGDPAAVRLLIFASIWIMIIASRAGARTVKLSKVRAAYSLGASKRQVLFRVILPNALPELFTGLRVALGVSWGTLVAAELVGTDTGLGSMIFQARAFLRADVVLVGIIIIAVIGVAMDVLMRFAEARLIPWRGKG